MERIQAWTQGLTSLGKLHWALWVFILISVPFTSSPLVAIVTGGSTVSPLAGIPLILLLVLWYIPYIYRTGTLPKAATPLLFFVGVALLSTVLALFHEMYPFLGQGPIDRGIRAMITLILGVGFYLVSASFPNTNDRLAKSLRWLYMGAVIMLFWSTIQIIVVFRDVSIPKGLWLLHRVFSIRDLLYTRVTGMAYEPSWLANLLVVLYLPLWLSSVIRGHSVFSHEPRRISLELGFLIWGLIVLFLSLSRIGLLSLFTILGTLGLVASWRLTGRLMHFIRGSRNNENIQQETIVHRSLRVILWLFFLLLGVLAMFGVVLLASRIDSRIYRLFQVDFLEIIRNRPIPIIPLTNLLAYAERVMFWIIGLRVFALFPFLGVGLGNTGFFFRELTHSFSYQLPEVVVILTGSAEFPNPKNLWVRLLAETGIVGFLTYAIWLFVMALGAWSLLKKGKGLNEVLGLASLLALLAQFWEGFSLDSFALPQLWIILGLTTAAITITYRTSRDSQIEHMEMD